MVECQSLKGPEVGEHASPARKAQEARRLVSRERREACPRKGVPARR